MIDMIDTDKDGFKGNNNDIQETTEESNNSDPGERPVSKKRIKGLKILN